MVGLIIKGEIFKSLRNLRTEFSLLTILVMCENICFIALRKLLYTVLQFDKKRNERGKNIIQTEN